MALRFPHRLPEPYRLPVIAVDATARTVLALDLKTAEANRIRGSGHLVDTAIEAAAVRYLIAVCASFTDQAFLAIQHRAMPMGELDASFEQFLDFLQHHVYYDQHHAQLKSVPGFAESVPFDVRTKRQVQTSEWHTSYLEAIPGLLAKGAEGRDLRLAVEVKHVVHHAALWSLVMGG